MRVWPALVLVLATSCCMLTMAAQAETAIGNTASSLPLTLPGFEEPAKPQMDIKPAPATGCAVSADQLPPEFLNLMSRLDEPVATTEPGLPPVVQEVAPAVAREVRQRVHGVQVLNGGGQVRLGRSRENGVTVYRGLTPEGR